MKITKELLYPSLLYSLPFQYTDKITLYPITMKDILIFNCFSQALLLRKNSIFCEKKILKMSYWDFIMYAVGNEALAKQCDIPALPDYFMYIYRLLELSCREQTVRFDIQTGKTYINGEEITPDKFDDIRQIILLQNGIEFNINEFMHYGAEQRLKQAQHDISKTQSQATIEDYIDSVVVALHLTENSINEMSIRKFWRYVKRCNSFTDYKVLKTGESSGMVTFKEPIKHWMASVDDENEYEQVKTSEEAIKNKIG